jgi:hypothetical protein
MHANLKEIQILGHSFSLLMQTVGLSVYASTPYPNYAKDITKLKALCGPGSIVFSAAQLGYKLYPIPYDTSTAYVPLFARLRKQVSVEV